MVKKTEILIFTRELAVLLKGGVALREALGSIASQSQFSVMKKVIERIIVDVENGQTLSHALGRYPKYFDHLYLSLVLIGEKTGSLPANLSSLALQIEKSYQLRTKIESIFLYPTIVFFTAMTMASVISVFILPKLVKLFDSFDITLPLATRALLWFAALMKEHGVVIFVALLGLLMALRLLTLVSIVKPVWHAILLKLPLMGSFLRSIYLSQFFRDIGVMLQSGLPLAELLSVEEKAMRNLVFSRMTAQLHRAALEGRTLSSELTEHYAELVPVTAVKMIAAGEQSGELGKTFLYLSDFLDEEVDRNAKSFTIILEPVLLIVIALVIAFLALAILSPIYSLTGSIHR